MKILHTFEKSLKIINKFKNFVNVSNIMYLKNI